jgi:DNA (cytosine-5)-methyltransferase 1
MSSARHDRGLEEDPDAGCKDARNLLVTVIERAAALLKPRVIVIENVPAFLTRKIRHPKSLRPISAADYIIGELKSSYVAFPIVCDLCDYGVPQSRKRTFITLVRKSEVGLRLLLNKELTPYPIPRYAPELGGTPITVDDALKAYDLPVLDASSAELACSDFGHGMHAVPVWNPERYAMVAAIPPGSGRSAWQNNLCGTCGEVEVSERHATCPGCRGPLLRPVVRSRNGRYRLIHGFRTSTYARMSSGRPASTITTASGHVGSNNTIHPTENRLLSTLECALLQTLPSTFRWGDALEQWGHTNVREMIGEAVPPLFTHLHGKVLYSLLTGRMPRNLLAANDARCSKAQLKLS